MKIEYVMVADHVDIQANRAYIHAGGWDTLAINTTLPLQAPHPCGVVVAFMIPWDQTNRRHDALVEVIDPDGGVVARIEGQVEAGRPASIEQGHEQRIHLGLNVGLPIQKLGRHKVLARTDDDEKSIGFNVVPGPGLQQSSAGVPTPPL